MEWSRPTIEFGMGRNVRGTVLLRHQDHMAQNSLAARRSSIHGQYFDPASVPVNYKLEFDYRLKVRGLSPGGRKISG